MEWNYPTPSVGQFVSLCFRLQVHHHHLAGGGRFVGCRLVKPGGATLHNDFVQRVRERSVIISDRIIRWQPVRWVGLVAGLHNSINMKVIVTAIRSTRDYWIHSSSSSNSKPFAWLSICHPSVLRLSMPFPFPTSSSECEYCMWYIISSYIHHIPHIMIFVCIAHWMATPVAHFNNCSPKRRWEDIGETLRRIVFCSKERSRSISICDWVRLYLIYITTVPL